MRQRAWNPFMHPIDQVFLSITKIQVLAIVSILRRDLRLWKSIFPKINLNGVLLMGGNLFRRS